MVVPPGSILVTSDAGDRVQGNAVLLDPTTGAVVGSLPFIYARTGDRLPSGVSGIGRERSSSDGSIVGIDIYDPSLTLIASITTLGVGNPQASPISGNTTDSIYAAITPFGFVTATPLYRISASGVLSPTSWSLPTSPSLNSRAMIGLAPAADNRWVYYTVGPTSELRSFDLLNNVPGPVVLTLLSSEAFIQPGNLLMLANGNLLVFVATAFETAFEVRQLTTAGVLVRTYPLDPAAANGDAPEIFRALDPGQFWVRTFPDGTVHTSLFTKYDLATGATLTSFPVTNLDGGGQVPTTCPNIVMGGSLPAACAVGIPSPPPTNKPACAPSGISGGQG